MGIAVSNANANANSDPRVEMAMTIYNSYKIGFHTAKLPKLAESIRVLGDYSRPYQIFLGNPKSARFNISEEDVALSARVVSVTGATIFVHSQYIINLCSWQVESLRKNLEYARIIGFKGVVVHVGKSVGKHPGESIMRMRDNILSVLECASADCPLLLETPAGQGTETLTGMEEFMDFVASIDDRRFGMCVDTCHTFACGHCPLDYIQRCVRSSPSASSRLRLVHFNDSKTECGSRKDRHEYIGMGHIGLAKMGDIAELCHSNGIPMVVE